MLGHLRIIGEVVAARDRADETVDEETAVDALLERLGTAITRRLASDVPVGFFLSGGVDSSLVTALAAESTGARIKTFTLTYEDQSTTDGKEQDRRWARWVADRYATDHVEETITCDDYPEAIRRIHHHISVSALFT